MAVTTKILADTKTHAKVLLTWNADAATTAAAVDASGLSGHTNGAKLHITNIVYGVGLGECKGISMVWPLLFFPLIVFFW